MKLSYKFSKRFDINPTFHIAAFDDPNLVKCHIDIFKRNIKRMVNTTCPVVLSEKAFTGHIYQIYLNDHLIWENYQFTDYWHKYVMIWGIKEED